VLKSGLEFVAIVAAYLALAELALWIAWINPSKTPVWPPTGLALALLLLRGRHVWPAVLIGSFASAVMTGHDVWLSALMSGAA
jgi:integral membrane sensor domain MASE1